MNYSFYVIVTTGSPEDTTIATVRTLIDPNSIDRSHQSARNAGDKEGR